MTQAVFNRFNMTTIIHPPEEETPRDEEALQCDSKGDCGANRNCSDRVFRHGYCLAPEKRRVK